MRAGKLGAGLNNTTNSRAPTQPDESPVSPTGKGHPVAGRSMPGLSTALCSPAPNVSARLTATGMVLVSTVLNEPVMPSVLRSIVVLCWGNTVSSIDCAGWAADGPVVP